MLSERIIYLAEKYFNGSCNPYEKEELAHFINDTPDDNIINELLFNIWNKQNSDEKMPDDMSERILSSLSPASIPLQQARFFQINRWKLAAAAVFLLSFSTFAYLLTKNKSKNQSTAENIKVNLDTSLAADVAPGGNKAVLMLGDGSQIVLDSANMGTLAQQGSTSIIKQQDGQLLYTSENGSSNTTVFNTLATPNGGQYKLVLSDGSKVWLNAASSLKYPTAFTGKERRVQITGEAYFEVSKDAGKPFIVEMNKMEVEVLGTHFNINSYDDEDAVKTTLLEGSVKVKNNETSGLLKPAQQAQLKATGKIKIVNDADLQEVVAWKEGNFQFENAEITTVMRQLARWYNVKVAYEGNITKHFGGSISRSVNLSKILDMLQQTGEVRFIIDGNKIIVKP